MIKFSFFNLDRAWKRLWWVVFWRCAGLTWDRLIDKWKTEENDNDSEALMVFKKLYRLSKFFYFSTFYFPRNFRSLIFVSYSSSIFTRYYPLLFLIPSGRWWIAGKRLWYSDSVLSISNHLVKISAFHFAIILAYLTSLDDKANKNEKNLGNSG